MDIHYIIIIVIKIFFDITTFFTNKKLNTTANNIAIKRVLLFDKIERQIIDVTINRFSI